MDKTPNSLMEYRTNTTGPWVGEPNYATGWYNGRRWIIMRNPVGALCGYVEYRNPQIQHRSSEFSNYTYEVTYESLPIECHGGLTFSGLRSFCEWNTRVSPFAVTIEEIYCIGFDCAHAGDTTILDFIEGYPKYSDSHYRTFDYVRHEIISICKQLDQMGN